MQTGANMGLITWDLLNDFFNHSQLKANFDAIDAHDHTNGKGAQIPAGGLAPNSVTSSTLAPNSIQTNSIANANITDAKLASPNSGIYRNLITGTTNVLGNTTAGTYIFAPAGHAVSGSTSIQPSIIYIDSTTLAVANKTAKLRVSGTVASNSIISGVNLSAGLYPVTVGGTSGTVSYTVGTVVSGSSVSFNNPIISTPFQFASADFNLPANGPYVLGLVIGSTLPANAAVGVAPRLELRHV